MFIIAYLRVWRVSTLSKVCMWTSRLLFMVRFLFHLILGITHVVVVLADVRSNICSSRSTNTGSLCVYKAKTSCTLSKWWLCRSDRRLWRQACDQLSKLSVELGVDHILYHQSPLQICSQYHAPVQSSFVQIYNEAPVLSCSPNRAPPAPRNFVILTWLEETENTQKYDPTSTNGMWCGGNHKSVKLFFCSYRFLPSSRW